MQPHIWYYYIIGTFQSEDLGEIISLHYGLTYCWINRLKIAVNSVPKYGNMSDITKCPNA